MYFFDRIVWSYIIYCNLVTSPSTCLELLLGGTDGSRPFIKMLALF